MSRAPRPRLPLFTGKPVPAASLPAPRELTLHFSVAKELARFCRPDWRWTHFPAGELRDDATGAKLKRMGTKPGWPDFILLRPDGLFHALELKRPGNDLDAEQEAFRVFCEGGQIPHAVARTIDEAWAALDRWGCLTVRLSGTGMTQIGGRP